MGGRALLVTIGGIMIISNSVFLNITGNSNAIGDTVSNNYSQYVSKSISQSGMNLALLQIRKNPSWRDGLSSLSVMDGVLDVSVATTYYRGKYALKVMSIGRINPGTSEERSDTSVAYMTQPFVPPPVKAALTSDHSVELNDGMILDGRDHTAAGVLTNPGGGTIGLYTKGSLIQGSGLAGGSAAGVDYVPSTHPNPQMVQTNQTPPDGYPNTPDSVMGGAPYGFPAGTLKAIAQSGINGSQYVTNPSSLKFPLKGVTYVDFGGQWEGKTISGSGIFILHNSGSSSECENMKGSFTGLFIGDEIKHINADIIGAVINLKGNSTDIGNGTGSILYSSEVLKSLGAITGGDYVLGGNNKPKLLAVWD